MQLRWSELEVQNNRGREGGEIRSAVVYGGKRGRERQHVTAANSQRILTQTGLK